jgi:phosphohistidine swiveling domain-containing protein
LTDAANRPVTFDLPGPEYEEATWIHNEHGAASSPQLTQTVAILVPMMGASNDEGGLPERLNVNSFGYTRAAKWPPESTLSPHLDDTSVPEDDSNLLDWRERCLPVVDEVVAEIDAFDPDAVVAGGWRDAVVAHQTRISEAMRLVHESAVFHAQILGETFVGRYIVEFGADKQAEGLALLQGFPNISTTRAAEFWDLGRIARRSNAVLSAITSGELPSGSSADEVEFRDGFELAIDKYGHVNPLVIKNTPTWREDFSMPLSIILQYSTEDDDRSPRVVEKAAVIRREELVSALVAAARTSTAAADLVRILPYGQHIGPVTEDHNLLADQRILNASRMRWLKVGEMLCGKGALEQAGDVFYYEIDELLELLESGAAIDPGLVSSRKSQLALWRTVIAPSVLGKGAQSEQSDSEEIVVTGMAASAGTYTGRARVITVVTEADRLEEGDVLVCDLTTPPWTPYFAVAGALVTNIGSVLAHGAIVAREFGIPAVVGTGNGTTLIPDGATVTVDGSTGTVTVVRD